MSDSYEVVELYINIYKASILCFMLFYIERLLGWVQNYDKNDYSEEKVYNVLCNPDVSRSWRCIKFKNFETSLEAKNYLNKVKVAVFQFPIIVFIIAIVGTFVIENESDSEDEILLILKLVRLVSIVVAVLALFSMAYFVDQLPEMTGLRIFRKLVVVKLGIVFADVQPLVIYFLAYENLIANNDLYTVDAITFDTQSIFICCEMLVFAILLGILFPASEYNTPPELKLPKPSN